VEKLEVELRPWANDEKVSVRLFAWTDRWVCIDARAATKNGWAWQWTFEGRLLGEFGGREIVGGLENTLDCVHNMDPRKTRELADIWGSLLAQGPKRIEPD